MTAPTLPPALPPGPRAPAAAQLASWAFRPVPFLSACARRYGDTFTIRFPLYPPFVFTSDPELVADVFAGDPGAFLTGRGNRILKPLLGEESLLLLDGERHKRRRRLVMPPFHGPGLREAAGAMREAADRHIDAWPRDRVFPVQPALADLALDIIIETVLGVRERGRRDALHARLVRLLSLGTKPGVFFFIGRNGEVRLTGLQKRLGRLSPLGLFLERKADVRALLHEEIARCRREGGTDGSVLSLLLQARAEDGTGLTDDELHDELMTLLVAGHETTATALAWALHALSRSTEVLQRALDQVDGGDGRYVDAVVSETMRLHPVVPMVVRLLASERRVGDRLLPAGVCVCPNVWLAHRRPELWPDPERFVPERFLGDAPRPWHFFPFGGGNRTCVGRAFALQEMRLVLQQLLRKRVPVAAPRYRPRVVRRGVTFAPSRGLPLRVAPR